METPAVASQTRLFVVTMALCVCDLVTNCDVDTNTIRVGRYSSVGIATRYGLDGCWGIESRWGARFSALFPTGPGAHPVSYRNDTGSYSGGEGVKRPGHGVDHPPNLAPRLKKE